MQKTTQQGAERLETKTRRQAQVMLCSGCCCGRVERGHPEVPIDLMKSEWKEHDLAKTVQLTISGCLGPCDLSNVVLLMLEDRQIWLGGLKTTSQYLALVDWARKVGESDEVPLLPVDLEDHLFERWASES